MNQQIQTNETSLDFIKEECKKTNTDFQEGMNEIFEVGLDALKESRGWTKVNFTLTKPQQDLLNGEAKKLKVQPRVLLEEWFNVEAKKLLKGGKK